MWLALPAVVLAGLIVGAWRGTQMLGALSNYQSFMGQKVVVIGTVVDDATYDNSGQRVMLLDSVEVDGKSLPGKVRIKTMVPVAPTRGDRLQATGKMYGGFGNYQAAIYFADAAVVTEVNNPIDDLRRWFAAQVYNVLPDTQAGLGLGFLVGLKSSLPEELNDQLKVLGLTHIVVASGFNLTVLVRLSRRIFAKSSHYQMTIACAAMVTTFVLVTGLSPSMVRAGLVAGLCIVAWYYGRRMHPMLIITLVAAVTALVNPLYVWSDIGWWLSFLAFGGVMLLAPLLQRCVFGEREPRLLGQVIIETVAAQITTLPLILFIFGTFSVLSLPANVLVVPLVPLAMLLTFIAGLTSAWFPWAAWPAVWLLNYLCGLIDWLARVPWASVPFGVGLPWFIFMNAAIVAVGFVLWRKTKHDYLSKSVIE